MVKYVSHFQAQPGDTDTAPISIRYVTKVSFGLDAARIIRSTLTLGIISGTFAVW